MSTTSCRGPSCGTVQRCLLCLCRILSMARFASEAELQTFLGRLDSDYSLNLHPHRGRMESEQHINLQLPRSHFCCLGVCQSCTLMTYKPQLIQQVGSTQFNACTVCLIVHRCCVHLLHGFVCTIGRLTPVCNAVLTYCTKVMTMYSLLIVLQLECS